MDVLKQNQRAGTQSIERASLVMRVIASRNGVGMRLVDVSRCAKLEQSTAHRILKCLITEGMVKRDPQTRRYHLGHLIFELGLAAASEFNVRAICHPSLVRLSDKTGDTVFLTIRSGFDTVCLDRREGAFPIKTLTLDIGTRRPLGVGAGGVALLMSLPDRTVDEIVNANALQLVGYGDLTVPAVLHLVRQSRELGYALNDRHITPGATSVGMAIRSQYGVPFLAISIGAISSRMEPERQQELAGYLRDEIDLLERSVSERAHPL
ncbi:MAG TPA: IclR family transcriptional regulator [Zeimonas sp.]